MGFPGSRDSIAKARKQGSGVVSLTLMIKAP